MSSVLTFADVIKALTQSRPEMPPLVIAEAAIDSRGLRMDQIDTTLELAK